jgi:hypothetical protein
MNRRMSLLITLAAALLISFIPFVHWPLKWFETLFHESSHSLAALLTGGHVDKIVLRFDGSGLTWSSGGFRPLVSFAGYAGSILWGTGLYTLASSVDDRNARHVVIGLLIAGVLESVTWLAFGFSSWIIMAVVLGTLAMLLQPSAARAVRPLLRLIGSYVLISGIVAPTYILSAGGAENDAKALAGMLWIPQFLWVAIWAGMGLVAIAWLYRQARRADLGEQPKISG